MSSGCKTNRLDKFTKKVPEDLTPNRNVNSLSQGRPSDDEISGVPRNFVRRGSTNSTEDRGLTERGPGGGSPVVRGSTQFAND
jgi:hypothetical protein